MPAGNMDDLLVLPELDMADGERTRKQAAG